MDQLAQLLTDLTRLALLATGLSATLRGLADSWRRRVRSAPAELVTPASPGFTRVPNAD